MRRENSIPSNNGPERKQDQAFESCFIKRRGRVKGALESLAGLAFLCTMKSVECPDEEAVSIRLPKIFSNIEFYPECTKNCSWRIKCGFRIQFMHISEALSIRIPYIYYSYKSASRIMRAAIREESRLTTSGSIVTEIPGKTGRSSCTIRVTFRSWVDVLDIEVPAVKNSATF